MSWNYENYFLTKIYQAKEDLGLDANLEVATEQSFARKSKLTPNTIYVVIKYLTSSLSYDVKTQPIQILVMSEQNTIESVQALFNKFAIDNNWRVEIDDTTYIKQSYTTPVVLSNFNDIANGYRSVLYLTGTLYIMENIIDLQDFTLDDISLKPFSFELSYVMSGNTQPIGGEKISSTVKSVATASITLSIPMLSQYEVIINKVLNIMKGQTSGNQDFTFNFTLNNISFNYAMKLTLAKFDTTPNEAPSLNLGFMR